MSVTEENFYMCLIKADDKIGIMMHRPHNNDKYCILGFDKESDGLDYFEKAYNASHCRSYEASMSACINYLTFRPSIVNLSLERVKSLITSNSMLKLGHVSGGIYILPLALSEGNSIWGAGSKPKLFA